MISPAPSDLREWKEHRDSPDGEALGGRPIARVRYSHDAIIDAIIAVPTVTQNELAHMFGYTQAWISNVIAADAFQERLHQRRAELIDPGIVSSVNERFRQMAMKAIDIVTEKLNAPAQMVSDHVALKAVELGARALGVGGFGAQIQVVASPAGDRLERLAERLKELNAPRRSLEMVEEAKFVEVAADAGGGRRPE